MVTGVADLVFTNTKIHTLVFENAGLLLSVSINVVTTYELDSVTSVDDMNVYVACFANIRSLCNSLCISIDTAMIVTSLSR